MTIEVTTVRDRLLAEGHARFIVCKRNGAIEPERLDADLAADFCRDDADERES